MRSPAGAQFSGFLAKMRHKCEILDILRPKITIKIKIIKLRDCLKSRFGIFRENKN